MDTRPDLARKGLVTLLQLGVSAVAAVGLAAYGIQLAQPRKPAPSEIPPLPASSSKAAVGSPVQPPVPVAVTTLPQPTSAAPSPAPPLPRMALTPEPEPLPDLLPEAPALPTKPVLTTAPPLPTALPTRGLPTRPDLDPAPSNTAAPALTGARTSAPAVEPISPRRTELDEYVHWLEMVQEERSRLRSRTDASSLRSYSVRQAIPGPRIANSSADPERTSGPSSGGLQRARDAVQSFEWRVTRAKPTVPSECIDLDRYYTEAIETETRRTSALIEAVARGDDAQIQALRRGGVSEVDRSLSIANVELERLARKHGIPQPPQLRTGQSGSLLGELTGPGGVR